MTDRRSNPAASPPTTISVTFAASSAAGTPYVKFERWSPSFMRDPPSGRIGCEALYQSQPCNRLAARTILPPPRAPASSQVTSRRTPSRRARMGPDSTTGLVVGTGDFVYDIFRPWGLLPAGWTFGSISHVAVDSKDRV